MKQATAETSATAETLSTSGTLALAKKQGHQRQQEY